MANLRDQAWRKETKRCLYCQRVIYAKGERCLSVWEARRCCSRLCGARLRADPNHHSDRAAIYFVDKTPRALPNAPEWPAHLRFTDVTDRESHVFARFRGEAAQSLTGCTAALAAQERRAES